MDKAAISGGQFLASCYLAGDARGLRLQLGGAVSLVSFLNLFGHGLFSDMLCFIVFLYLFIYLQYFACLLYIIEIDIGSEDRRNVTSVVAACDAPG